MRQSDKSTTRRRPLLARFCVYKRLQPYAITGIRTVCYKNQHLPNVPSVAEVEVNGVDLGEMNTTLLKKVEELTLYIIQMEKRLSELENVKIMIND